MIPEVATLTGYCPRCGTPLEFLVALDRIGSQYEALRGTAVTAEVQVSIAYHECPKEKK